MKKPLVIIGTLLLLPVFLTACVSGKEVIEYENSVITPTLEIPPDLITREQNKNLSLPGSKIGKPENTGRFVETGNLTFKQSSVEKVSTPE